MGLLYVAVGALCFLVVVSAVEDPLHLKKSLHVVKSQDELWRYQVGQSGGTEKDILSVGTDHICLRAWTDHYLKSKHGKADASAAKCSLAARFEVGSTGKPNSHLFSLKTHDGKYLSCSYPDFKAVDAVGANQMFALYTNNEKDILYLYSESQQVFVEVDHAHNDELICRNSAPSAAGTFYGWKLGDKEVWKVRVGWELKGFCGNDNTSGSFDCKLDVKVGVEQMDKTVAGVATFNGVTTGASFKNFFIGGLGTGDDHVWVESTSDDTWTEVAEFSGKAAMSSKQTVYQAVGTYGVYKVYSNQFKAGVDEASATPITLTLTPAQPTQGTCPETAPP